MAYGLASGLEELMLSPEIYLDKGVEATRPISYSDQARAQVVINGVQQLVAGLKLCSVAE